MAIAKKYLTQAGKCEILFSMIKEEKEEEKRNKNFLAVARKRLTQAGNYEILPVTIENRANAQKEKKS